MPGFLEHFLPKNNFWPATAALLKNMSERESANVAKEETTAITCIHFKT